MTDLLRVLLPIAAVLAIGCGAPDDAVGPFAGPAGDVSARESAQGSLAVTPRLELVGLGDLYEDLRVRTLSFRAEIYLLAEGDESPGGDAIEVDFEYSAGEAWTLLTRRPLQLDHVGRYSVLVRLRPASDGTSVHLEGAYHGDDWAQFKGDDAEPVPSPADEGDAEPVPSPAEPVPSPADEDDAEPVPSPADEGAEPVPSPADDDDDAEPVPSPADEGDPTASADDDDAAEPVPSPAEPVPSPADGEGAEPVPSPAHKPDDEIAGGKAGAGEEVIVRSRRTYEFYAGMVEISAADTHLVVTWDVRGWLRSLLANALGLEAPDPGRDGVNVLPGASDGFEDGGQFRLDAD